MVFELPEDVLVEAIHLPINFMNVSFDDFREVVQAGFSLTLSRLKGCCCCPDTSRVTLERTDTLPIILLPTLGSSLIVIVA